MNANIAGAELKKAASNTSVELNGEKYELALDMNALCDLEERYGSFSNAMKELEKIENNGGLSSAGGINDIRFLLCVMLRHTDDKMTEREAGKMIDMANLQKIVDLIGEVMSSSTPQSDDDEKNVKGPQKS